MPALELHPVRGNTRFTLRGIFADAERANAKAAELEGDGMKTWVFENTAPSGKTLHFVAARHDVEPASRAGIPQDHSAHWEATRMAVQIFRETLRAANKGGRSTRWYKKLDVEALHACLQKYRWNGTRLQVAASILSTTIIVHPFPNANHRTSISLARYYLTAEGIKWPKYTLRGEGANRLFRDTHAFFRESKYLLQLLRHKDLVRVALQEGYTHLGIGVNTEAEIRAADLALTAAQIKEKHAAACEAMIRSLADPKTLEALNSPATRKLRGWVDWFKA